MDDLDIPPVTAPKTHPHIATILIDPVRWYDFQRTFEDRPEVKILKSDRSTPDTWTIYVGCASKRVRELIESGW